MRPRGSARRSSVARRARGRRASSDLGLLARQLQIQVLERAAAHLDVLELEALGERLAGQLVEDARRLVGGDDELLAVAAVADLDPSRAGEQLRGRAGGDDAPVAEDGEAIGEGVCLLHVVRGQEDALAKGPQVPDGLPGLAARRRIEAGRRLVQEDELRIADERERKVEAAQLSARECADARFSLLAETHELDHLADVPRPLVIAGEELEDLPDGEKRIDGRGLEDDADAGPKRAAAAGRIGAQHPHGALVSVPVALEDLDGGRLAGAVRAEEGEHLAGLDAEADPVQDLACAVRLLQVGDLDRAHAARILTTSRRAAPTLPR